MTAAARAVSDGEIRGLLERASRATPRPWRAGFGRAGYDDGIVTEDGTSILTNSGRGATSPTTEDAEYLAKAANLAPALATEVLALRERGELLKQALLSVLPLAEARAEQYGDYTKTDAAWAVLLVTESAP